MRATLAVGWRLSAHPDRVNRRHPPILGGVTTDPVPATAGGLIRRTLGRQRRALAGAIALITLWQICEAGVPVLIGVVIDRAVASGDVERLLLWGAVLCVHFAVLSLGYRFGSRIGFRAEQEESHRLRTEIAAHVLAPRGARTERLAGDVLSVATADADAVGTIVRQLTMTTAALIGLVVSGIVLATIDPLVAVVVLVGVPVVLVCTQVLAPRLAHRSHARQESIGLATGLATDLVRGLRPLKGIGAEAVALDRYRGRSRTAMHASVAAARWEGLLYGVTQGISIAFLAAVALIAGHRALSGEMSIGELVAVVGLAQFVAEPMGLLAYLVAQLARSRASARRIVDLLGTSPLALAGDRSADGPPRLAFEAVRSGSLDDVTFDVEPGALVALVAEEPADAAALMALLRGETAPDAGRVLLDGVPLTELRIDESRRRLLVAEHHIDLFEGTLRSNVDPLGILDGERLADVLVASGCADIVAGAEHGLDEHVQVDGTTLSGGQRQRLGLARALGADPRVLVLHDPTTAVDAVTEQLIADRLPDVRRAPGQRTTLVLTSSPALLARADLVVWIRGGEVTARAGHAELVADPAYRTAVLR